MFTCDESELGGTQSVPIGEAREMIAAQRERDQAKRGKGEPVRKTVAVPMGRMARRNLKKGT